MSSYAQAQSTYGQNGWVYTNARTPAPARNAQFLPLIAATTALPVAGYTMLLTGPLVWA